VISYKRHGRRCNLRPANKLDKKEQKIYNINRSFLLFYKQKTEENKMNDLYIWFAIIAGITVWTTFGRAWQHYMLKANNTRKGWSFFFHPFTGLLEDETTVEDIVFGPLAWAIE
jgi:hypothetical protein